ncbi:hypothetical protein [Ottowia sp.]|uniref:hypothetical protein n=1 Tax=Ottowia sp. TaxID=1898956 RepID=UPI0034535E62
MVLAQVDRAPQLPQWMTRRRSAKSAISGAVSWRTKPFSIMNDEKVEKCPCRCGQRYVM